MLFRGTLLFLLSVPILVGYLWMFISTFAVRTHGLMPVDAQGNFGGLTLANWVFLKDPVLWTALGNTFLLAAGLTVFTVMISSMAGYALARIQFRFRQQLLSLTLVLHAFPSVTLLIAIYFVLKGLSAAPVLGPWIGYNTMGTSSGASARPWRSVAARLLWHRSPKGAFGLSVGAIWVENDSDYGTARRLIEEYDRARALRVRQQYELATQGSGLVATLLNVRRLLVERPHQALLYAVIIVGLVAIHWWLFKALSG